LLAVAQEDWDWAAAGGCDFEGVWAGVSVSFYVDVGAFYGFVDCCQAVVSLGVLPAAVMVRLGWWLLVLAFP
jgi:hypothetical protein